MRVCLFRHARVGEDDTPNRTALSAGSHHPRISSASSNPPGPTTSAPGHRERNVSTISGLAVITAVSSRASSSRNESAERIPSPRTTSSGPISSTITNRSAAVFSPLSCSKCRSAAATASGWKSNPSSPSMPPERSRPSHPERTRGRGTANPVRVPSGRRRRSIAFLWVSPDPSVT